MWSHGNKLNSKLYFSNNQYICVEYCCFLKIGVKHVLRGKSDL